VLRYTRRGRLDPTFGGDGRVITDVSRGDDQANGVAIQADGKIVVAGRSGKDNRKFALVRYNTDGTLDSTFAEDGKVTTDFTNARDQANAVAIQADGKIVAVGRSGGADFAVARFNTDGALDATFGGDGKVTTDFTHGDDPANAVAVQPDGKIVAAGGGPKLARYNIDGTLDPTFGGDGKVIPVLTCCPAFVSVYDATLQSNGKIITAGEWFECFAAGDCEDDVVVTRYDSDGTLDTTFASGGVAFGICGRANAVALQADGKIVAAGVVDCGGGDKALGDFVIERLDADGARDGTFGNRGDVLTSFTEVGSGRRRCHPGQWQDRRGRGRGSFRSTSKVRRCPLPPIVSTAPQRASSWYISGPRVLTIPEYEQITPSANLTGSLCRGSVPVRLISMRPLVTWCLLGSTPVEAYFRAVLPEGHTNP
jgi:uncharacterized delta-60 repeat protein